MGAKNVFVTLGEAGGLFLTEENEIIYSPSPKGTLVNSTGAGDSALAVFLAEYENKKDFKRAFLMGVAAGSACAFSAELATREHTLKLLNEIPENEIICMKI